jgi:succinate dehydrogenase / fumarate reductase membrane anchor subunit
MSESRNNRIDVLRSPLGRVRGLGAAHAGAHHWWLQRLTALALVPLTLWFIASAIHVSGFTRDQTREWLSGTIPLSLMLLLVVISFYHLQLGLQVVIEDYVHANGPKMTLLFLNKGLCALLAVICIVSALRAGL